ncbi:hypothetical protein [Psychrobacter sp. AOP7-B1-24]|uniref:hypothetical protein n=1 Tax=Psychrobacter sp. AOP7-B1-24 TaxID=3457645 RepID=UPI00402BBA25
MDMLTVVKRETLSFKGECILVVRASDERFYVSRVHSSAALDMSTTGFYNYFNQNSSKESTQHIKIEYTNGVGSQDVATAFCELSALVQVLEKRLKLKTHLSNRKKSKDYLDWLKRQTFFIDKQPLPSPSKKKQEKRALVNVSIFNIPIIEVNITW